MFDWSPFLLALPKANRLLLSREVVVELKESWNLLKNFNQKARAGGSSLMMTSSMLSLYSKIRNFFQKFPNAEF